MRSPASASCGRVRHGAGRLAHPGALLLACALCASSGCAAAFGPLGEDEARRAGARILLSEVSRSFHEDNERWPRDYEELMTYCEEVDLLTLSDVAESARRGGIDIDMYMFKELLFTPRRDGTLEIDFTTAPTFRADGTRTGYVTGTATVRVPDDEGESAP
ncbi:MAG: hypothetical protein GXY35_06730 [Chlamydiae bacterium]|nr:hypothetical protein [Chlamydiota bacterium]